MEYTKNGFKHIVIFNAVLFVILILIVGLENKINYQINTKKEIEKYILQKEQLKIELSYVTDVSKIMDYYYKENICMRFNTIKTMLKAIDHYIPSYFPDGPFTRNDFIALALTETTNFNQYTTGTSGEIGLFQITPEMCAIKRVRRNQFDVYVNTELAMFVMAEKYKQHKQYYSAIIAYNGVILDKNTKKWRDNYWKRFISYRKDVGIIFNEGGDN